MLDDMGAKKETKAWPDVVRLSSDEQKARLARLEEAMCAKLGAMPMSWKVTVAMAV